MIIGAQEHQPRDHFHPLTHSARYSNPVRTPRVAYLPDSFHEVNGVAHTSRNFFAYAQRHDLPFLCIRAGTRPQALEENGNLRSLELPRSRASIRIEKDLQFDPLFWRHAKQSTASLLAFSPTSSTLPAQRTRHPRRILCPATSNSRFAASWHTNVHEYAARRLDWLNSCLSPAFADTVSQRVEGGALFATSRFYSLARVLYAPNDELCGMLESSHASPLLSHAARR